MKVHIRSEHVYSDIDMAQCHGINNQRTNHVIVNRQDFMAIPENDRCQKCTKHAQQSGNLVTPVRKATL